MLLRGGADRGQCIGYVSITADYTKEWKQWWHNPEDVKL